MLHARGETARELIRDHLHDWSAVMRATIDSRTTRQHTANFKRFLWAAKVQHVSQLNRRTIQQYIATLAGGNYAPSTRGNYYVRHHSGSSPSGRPGGEPTAGDGR